MASTSLSIEITQNLPYHFHQHRNLDTKEQGAVTVREEKIRSEKVGNCGGCGTVGGAVIAGKNIDEREVSAVGKSKGDHIMQLQLNLDQQMTESGDSEPTNHHSEGKDSNSKQDEPSILKGKVAVTRSSSRRRLAAQPVTPRLEEPRSVRPNRGVKRRYPGEESDENSTRKRTRLRSISRVCGPINHPASVSEVTVRGKISSGNSWKQRIRGQHRGRQSEIFICNFEGCEKSFTESSALYNHGRVHGDRPYLCHYEGCSKRFSERSKLKRHFLIHTGEKPFICVYEGCGKAFSLDFNLRSHMKTHTGEYHECPHAGCEKRYCQEYKLRAHICKEHEVTAKPNENRWLLPKQESVISSNDVATRKNFKAEQLQAQMDKLERCVEGRKNRIRELELELQGEEKELIKVEKILKKLIREQEQAGLKGCAELDLSSDNAGEAEFGEVYGEKEVIMLAHRLPTGDQGAQLMDQAVFIKGATRPLSPSISSSQQPFFMSRLPMSASQPSFNRPIHFLPYSISCSASHSSLDCFYSKQGNEQLNGSELSSGHGRATLQDKPTCDVQSGRVSPSSCQNAGSDCFLHDQTSQCEPPVSQLFIYQEQPCLQV